MHVDGVVVPLAAAQDGETHGAENAAGPGGRGDVSLGSDVEEMSEAKSLRVAVVEDDETTRGALGMLLAGEPNLEVTGSFADGGSLLAAIDELQTDVVLVDLGLPDMAGPDLIAALKTKRPTWEVLVHTISETRDVVFAALRAGATGYLLKGCTPRELIEGLQTVAAGGAPMSPSIARSVVRTLQSDASLKEDYLLSARERDVLQLIERGRSYKEVAAQIGISPHTVHSHIKKIYEKLHAQSRDEAVRIARMKGLV